MSAPELPEPPANEAVPPAVDPPGTVDQPEVVPPLQRGGPSTEQRIAAIVSRGQKKRPGGAFTAVLLLLSAFLTWLSFPPVDFGPLAWVCLVPFLQLVRPVARTLWMYRLTYGISVLYWLATLQWMRLGDPTMYIALVAMALYLASYSVVFLWVARIAVHRLAMPLVVIAPVVWGALDYLRAYVFTGFSWYYIGHTQYRWIDLIQVSDLGGAYLVTFLIVAANAALAVLVSPLWLARRHLSPTVEKLSFHTPSQTLRIAGVVGASALVIVAMVYGSIRRAGEAFPRGPRVALIQGNFVATVRNNLNDPREIYMTHRDLSGLTVALNPDVVVWPEGMFPYGLYLPEKNVTDENLKDIIPEIPPEFWRDKQSQETLADLAEMMNAALIIGTSVCTATPTVANIFNSAAFIVPGKGYVNRYDKIHRVPFGEYIPLKDSLPFLQSFTPFRGRFGIDAGAEAHIFRHKDWELVPLICFEDTVPHLVRRIVKSSTEEGDQRKQVLVNMTNDGWFHGSSELEQHLITSLFRAVETRTPLVRAVNTGISAIIDGDGVIRNPDEFIDGGSPGDGQPRRKSIRDPKTGRFYKQMNCALVADVPLDPRTSLYVFWGDLFALVCLTATIAVVLIGVLSNRASKRPAAAKAPTL